MKQEGPALRTDKLLADIQLANGKRLIASNIGGGAADPLRAELANDELCALRRMGGLSVRIALSNTEHIASPQMLAVDLAKSRGFAKFAAAHCGK